MIASTQRTARPENTSSRSTNVSRFHSGTIAASTHATPSMSATAYTQRDGANSGLACTTSPDTTTMAHCPAADDPPHAVQPVHVTTRVMDRHTVVQRRIDRRCQPIGREGAASRKLAMILPVLPSGMYVRTHARRTAGYPFSQAERARRSARSGPFTGAWSFALSATIAFLE